MLIVSDFSLISSQGVTNEYGDLLKNMELINSENTLCVWLTLLLLKTCKFLFFILHFVKVHIIVH